MKLKIDFSFHRIKIAVAIVFLLLFISGCQMSNDMPPDIEGPDPEPHNGIFVSKNAIFTFDGSKKTVFVEFDEEYMEALNNPPNYTYYSYTFTWYEFGEYRYDGATNLKLYHEESSTQLDFTLEGIITANRITISYIIPGNENLVFIKQ
jgi:hypothetical protein